MSKSASTFSVTIDGILKMLQGPRCNQIDDCCVEMLKLRLFGGEERWKKVGNREMGGMLNANMERERGHGDGYNLAFSRNYYYCGMRIVTTRTMTYFLISIRYGSGHAQASEKRGRKQRQQQDDGGMELQHGHKMHNERAETGNGRIDGNGKRVDDLQRLKDPMQCARQGRDGQGDEEATKK